MPSIFFITNCEISCFFICVISCDLPPFLLAVAITFQSLHLTPGWIKRIVCIFYCFTLKGFKVVVNRSLLLGKKMRNKVCRRSVYKKLSALSVSKVLDILFKEFTFYIPFCIILKSCPIDNIYNLIQSFLSVPFESLA